MTLCKPQLPAVLKRLRWRKPNGQENQISKIVILDSWLVLLPSFPLLVSIELPENVAGFAADLLLAVLDRIRDVREIAFGTDHVVPSTELIFHVFVQLSLDLCEVTLIGMMLKWVLVTLTGTKKAIFAPILPRALTF